jgi:hypothetical protein
VVARALTLAFLAVTLLSGNVASARVCAIAPVVDDNEAAARHGLDVGASHSDRAALVDGRAGSIGAGVRTAARGSIGPAALSTLSLDLRAQHISALVDDAERACPYRALSRQHSARAPPISP